MYNVIVASDTQHVGRCVFHVSTRGLHNLLTAGPDYIRFFIIFHWNNKYQLLNMFKIKCDINEQDFKIHFVKFEYFSLI